MKPLKKETKPEVTKALAAYQATLDSTNPAAPYAVAIEGGDIDAGRRIFYNHGAAQCTRCHKAQRERKGGIAGPDLKNVGLLHDRKYLLESLLNPATHIAPGYGTVSLTLKNGNVVAGTLTKQNKKQVTLNIPIDDKKSEKKTFPRDQIVNMTQPMSTMPPMIGVLSKSEARDLVAYLASLKDKKK